MADTLAIHQSPSENSPVVAHFTYQVPEPYIWHYTLEVYEPGIESNALEFGYEVLGLPLAAAEAEGDWFRVIYGTTAEGALRYGWVQGVAGRTEVLFWADELLTRHLFFLGPDAEMAFYDEPGGALVDFGLAPRDGAGDAASDYRLEPLEADGRWLKVRVVTPDDSCTADPLQTRERILWIEYLDQRGRPRVWYHTRGC